MPSVLVVLLRMFEHTPTRKAPGAIYARVAPPAGSRRLPGSINCRSALGDEAKVNSGVDETLQLLLEFGVLAQSERGLALTSGLPTRNSDRAYVGRLLRVSFSNRSTMRASGNPTEGRATSVGQLPGI